MICSLRKNAAAAPSPEKISKTRLWLFIRTTLASQSGEGKEHVLIVPKP
jgi:hypothetical protein